jgi:hypothetical protein
MIGQPDRITLERCGSFEVPRGARAMIDDPSRQKPRTFKVK